VETWVTKYPQLENVSDPKVFLDKAVIDKPEGKTYEVTDRFVDNIMLELALFVGVIHLCLSMARYAYRHWALIGWILFMIGGYLWTTSHFNYTSFVNFAFGISKETAASVGKDLSYLGLFIAIVCAFIQERLYGILEITKLISILADTLSYLRLYALGMAGGILAATINEFVGAMPLVLGIIVAFLAHTFNMALGVMGGVIHGLRLNFLEWYHYSFYGGGKQFKPLRILTKDE
jgi:V/A-type H+/Na+-transporting ATPase subunit I